MNLDSHIQNEVSEYVWSFYFVLSFSMQTATDGYRGVERSRNPEGSLNYLLSFLVRTLLDEPHRTEDGIRIKQGFTVSRAVALQVF